MEYRLIQQTEGGAIYGIKEDGLATGPLRDNDFRDADRPDAAIRIAWAESLDFTTRRPELWDNDRYVVLATDRDPLSAVVDQPQSLDPNEPQ